MRWAVTDGGSRIPLDPEPTPNGNITVTTWREGNPVVKVWGKGTEPPADEQFRYVSHFATCPAAGQHRRHKR